MLIFVSQMSLLLSYYLLKDASYSLCLEDFPSDFTHFDRIFTVSLYRSWNGVDR